MNLTSEIQLAEQFGLAPERLADLRRKHSWPHIRLGRFDIRYTEQQVEQIIEMQSKKADPVVTPGGPKIAGQTKRSANRKKS